MRAAPLVTLVVIAACGGAREARPRPTGAVRLFSDGEVADQRARLAARLDATQRRSCPRPVLRGEPSPGPAGPARIALDRADGDLGACLTALAQLAKATKLADAVTARDPRLVELDARCGAQVAAAVTAAGAHEDGCSPFQVGGGVARHPLRTMHVAHLLALRAQAAPGSTDRPDGLWLVLDGVRYAHDLARGHTTLVAAMVAVASTDALLDGAAAILATTSPTPTAVEALVPAVDALLASSPPFGEALQGEADSMALYFGAELLEPAGWAPPGGWPADLGPRARPTPAADPLTPDPRDEGALSLVVAAQVAALLERACPASVPLRACRDQLAAQAQADAATAPPDLAAVYAELVTKALAPGAHDLATLAEGARVRIRDQIVATLMAVARPAYHDYAAKLAGVTARLAALRLELEVRRVIARTGQCPSADALTAPPFAALRAPAALGDALVITATPASIEIAPPAWVASRKPPWRVRCPPA